MVEKLKKETEERMKKAVENTRAELSKIRTGKASPALLDAVRINYFGSSVPIQQVASISTPEVRLITIQPWDRKMIGEIEKAILKSDLGLTPVNDGTVIRLPIPPLTEERRKDMVRLCHKLAEEGRIAIRNIRRDANDQLRKAEKNHEISEDEMHWGLEEIQKLTDTYVSKIDELLKKKEAEVMEV